MFQLKKLKHSFSSYSPYIDPRIMELHYLGHYGSYLKNLNNAFQKYPKYFEMNLKDILSKINEVPDEIRNAVRDNGGGVANHELFWNILSTKENIAVPEKLKKEIEKTFSSFENLKEIMIKKLSSHFGSGWIWLVLDKDKKLKAYSLPNQDSPYMQGDCPILGIDIWEHAYYLQYENLRTNYLENVWKIIDWNIVEENYNSALT